MDQKGPLPQLTQLPRVPVHRRPTVNAIIQEGISGSSGENDPKEKTKNANDQKVKKGDRLPPLAKT